MTTREMKHRYIYSNYHRVIHADGIYGGQHPSRPAMSLSFFSERIQLPDEVHFQVQDQDEGLEVVGEPQKFNEHDVDVLREIEATVYFDLSSCLSTVQWMVKHLRDAGVDTDAFIKERLLSDQEK